MHMLDCKLAYSITRRQSVINSYALYNQKTLIRCDKSIKAVINVSAIKP
jgi:hypothetical protein